ncbi:next to BRCA1 gene 1 protein isoform X1 [Talpa occidentalis]|uniref:next to BRCA1 gene 1 protein isoform X1 n=1 Tax=Talpa occidentalis TaxID=50954 RepID=UPI00188EFD74|nr:next to BRCA1 gene 1 protein isoform X1 [Talpa occidentalis]XP_037347431.1 next to BRCA1 gene 1 protein isoform X1 [Talpa occidentalis]XP_037347432.1 next to BRCA1 gene 1 protein isoform X1 [Talpa occidentalis]XP_054544743.1 next to BRCA1 gene 1 protein isoform X1 [Talpa occidentalis]
MEPQVTLNVTKGYCISPTQSILVPQHGTTGYCKNKTQSFLVSDPEITTWADVEAMVKVSFDLNTIQIKYLDEENEEVSINSQGEYEEALKMAVKQGNQLQMQVHEGYHVVDEAPPPVVAEKRPVLRAGKKTLAHYSSLVRVLGSDMKTPEEPAAQPFPHAPCDADQPQDKPPDWFTSYLETFREQVVKETVEKLEQKLHEKLVLQNPSLGSCPSDVSMPISEETLFLPENQFNWHIACSNCQRRIIGVRYQCSLCPSYNICEDCESGPYAHDSNHVLMKLRRPVVGSSEPFSHSKFSSPRLPAALEQARLQKQVDKNFLKAEKQRLRAEKKQRKAEVKELKKQLKLHRKIHLWNSIHGLQSPKSPLGRPESLLQSNTLILPLQPCTPVMPTLSAAFVDENLPDGTHLQPGTKFIKHWRMKNTGNVKWSADTKLKFMWGNLTLASTEKDVLVPCVKAGHVGVVSVEFIAPTLEGTYTSHWRLSHKGQQFGPRVWCSIIVDPFSSTESPDEIEKGVISSSKDDLTCQQEETFLLAKEEIQLGEATEQTEGTGTCIPPKTKNTASERELYIPSVDLLTAQDLLSFELLDINIVQELERVPHNTPVDMTPCMSPLPHDSPLIEKPGLGQIQEESEGAGFKALPDSTGPVKRRAENSASAEEEDDLSGTQFVCETVIRSLTLDAAPDHNPPCRQKSLHRAELQLHTTEEQQPVVLSGVGSKDSSLKFSLPEEGPLEDEREEIVHIAEEEAITEEEDELRDEVQSQSSASSEDYIIILPECFDTSRPLGDSMYSSALSQPGLERGAEGEPRVEAGQEPVESEERTPGRENQAERHSINDILMTSQTLDTVPLTPEVVGPPPRLLRSPPCAQHHGSPGVDLPVTIPEVSSVPDQIRGEPRGSSGLVNSRQKSYDHSRQHHHGNSIAGGLVKGALSVATSAYKALFAGPPITAQPIVSEEKTAALMAHLFEMGFCDRQLNLRLLKKHNYNIIHVVTELLHISNNDWYSHRY